MAGHFRSTQLHVASLTTESPLIFWSRSLCLKRVLSQGDIEKITEFCMIEPMGSNGYNFVSCELRALDQLPGVFARFLRSSRVSGLGLTESVQCQASLPLNTRSVSLDINF